MLYNPKLEEIWNCDFYADVKVDKYVRRSIVVER